MKALNIKNMKETLINCSGTQDEMDKIWDSFYQMATLGFIDSKAWEKFYNECAGWYITEDQSEVRDSRHEDKVIWTYGGEIAYRA